MKYKIMFLMLFSGIILSCKKITNVKLVDSASTGKLSYKIVDDSGNGLSGVKVSIYENKANSSGIYYDPTALIDTLRTDQSGVAAFSALVPANYLLVTDSPVVNKVKYNTREFAQVVAGVEKTKITKVSEFSGSLRITLKSNLDYSTPLKNMGVAAITYNPRYISANDIKSYANAAIIVGVTNDNGLVTLKIPSNVTYYLLAYSLNKGAIASWFDTYLVEKDMSTPVSLYMSPVNQ